MIIAAVWILYALFKFIILFVSAVPGFIINLFREQPREELKSV